MQGHGLEHWSGNQDPTLHGLAKTTMKRTMTLKCFPGPSGLSPLPVPILHTCSGGPAALCKAKAVVIPHVDIKTLKEFNRNKKLAKKNDVVLASESD